MIPLDISLSDHPANSSFKSPRRASKPDLVRIIVCLSNWPGCKLIQDGKILSYQQEITPFFHTLCLEQPLSSTRKT